MDDLYGNSVPLAYFIIAAVLFVIIWAAAVHWAGAWGLTLGFLPAAAVALIFAYPLAFMWPLMVFLPIVLLLNIGKRTPRAQWRSAEIAGQGRTAKRRAY